MQSEEERGVRMKSVGLLAVGYLDLHLHQDFLQRQARFDFSENSLLVLYSSCIGVLLRASAASELT